MGRAAKRTHSGLLLSPRGLHVIAFQEKILEILDQHEWIPQEIWVSKEKAYQIISPVTQKLGIRLKLVPELPVLSEMAEGMLGHMSSSRRALTVQPM